MLLTGKRQANKGNVPKKKKEMCLRPRPITFNFFLSRLIDIKCISYYMYTYTFVYVCKIYIDYNKSFTKQYSSIYKQCTYLFSVLICFTSLKIQFDLLKSFHKPLRRTLQFGNTSRLVLTCSGHVFDTWESLRKISRPHHQYLVSYLWVTWLPDGITVV